MKTNGSDYKGRAVATAPQASPIVALLQSKKADIASALPRGTINIERFYKSALMLLSDPKSTTLRQCTPLSVYTAILESAKLGLEVGGILGQAYLIPYSEHGTMTCHFQISYKGHIELARRSGLIRSVSAEAIHENDIFELELASGRHIHHTYDVMRPRGDIVAYYAMIELATGGEQFYIMRREEIEAYRNKYSKTYTKALSKGKADSDIWTTNFDAMAKKTVLIQALKLCPLSVEEREAMVKDEQGSNAIRDTPINITPIDPIVTSDTIVPVDPIEAPPTDNIEALAEKADSPLYPSDTEGEELPPDDNPPKVGELSL